VSLFLPDVAFVDRADIKAYIGLPSLQARYEILRSAVWELARAGIISMPAVGTLKRFPYAFLQLSGSRYTSIPATRGGAFRDTPLTWFGLLKPCPGVLDARGIGFFVRGRSGFIREVAQTVTKKSNTQDDSKKTLQSNQLSFRHRVLLVLAFPVLE
jgi:hypothetical protein